MISTDTKKIRPEKQAIVQEIKARVDGAGCLFIVSFAGISVAKVNELRARLREVGAEFHISKNQLIRRAMLDQPYVEELAKVLHDATGVITGAEDAVEVAKVIQKFGKEFNLLAVKAGVVEGRAISSAEVDQLADLPSKLVLQAMLVGTLAAPMTQLVGVFQQKASSIVYVLNAYKEKKAAA